MKLNIGSFGLGIIFILAILLLNGMSSQQNNIGKYMGWGDASNSRYMLDTSNGQLYLWSNSGWVKQNSKIE